MRAALIAFGLSAAAALATGATMLPQQALNALTPIDTVPTKSQIDTAFMGSQTALQQLAEIATNVDQQDPIDVGVRLRAIHALAKYCGSPADGVACSTSEVAHQAVAQVLTTWRLSTSGSGALILRAAIETLGTMKVAGDVSTLVPLLDHPSRDIRAATARALRDLCNTQAVTPLTARYSTETTDQVKLAISEALRILGQCAASP
jgi:hypothetical protein